MRRPNVRMPITAEISVAQVITEQDNNIRLPRRFLANNTSRNKQKKEYLWHLHMGGFLKSESLMDLDQAMILSCCPARREVACLNVERCND